MISILKIAPFINTYKLFILGFFSLFSIHQLNAQQNSKNTSPLNSKQESIVSIAALTANGDLTQLKVSLDEGLNNGLNINEIREILIHLYAYTGFPRSLQGINTFIKVLEERKEKGIEDNTGKESSPVNSSLSKYQQGKNNLESLTGQPERFPKTGYAAFAPIIDTFLKEHLFADIFNRNILSFSERELVTIAALSSMNGVEPMLRSHLNIAIRLGFSDSLLHEVMNIIEIKVGKDKANSGREVLYSINSPNSKRSYLSPASINNNLFAKGIRAPEKNFTGVVWVNMLVPANKELDCSAGVVTFEQGARTAWHQHPGGQILLVTEGKGFYQERGRRKIAIQKGDVISCVPGTEHWHGASPNSPLTHIAIGPNADKGAAIWLEKVSEKEYLNNK